MPKTICSDCSRSRKPSRTILTNTPCSESRKDALGGRSGKGRTERRGSKRIPRSGITSGYPRASTTRNCSSARSGRLWTTGYPNSKRPLTNRNMQIRIDEIPGAVKQLRKSKGISQTDLARGAGVCLKTVHRLENGLVGTSISSLRDILKALSDDGEEIRVVF